MDDSANLNLPYIFAAQSQKHVTHNEAIRMLDALLQLSVLDRDLTAPPASPAEGTRYIVATGASGDWSGHDLQVAAWQDGAWAFFSPGEGWLAWVADEDALLAWDGSAWVTAGGEVDSVNPAPLVGVNTTADATNRLAVASDASLFSHDDVTPGSGDHRAKINKAATGNTAALLFQTAFSGRAEFGLTGDDDWHVKVSPDGATFFEGLVADRNNGHIALPFTRTVNNFLVNGGFSVNQRVFGGGALSAASYGHDRWKADAGGANYSVSGAGVTTHNSGTLVQVIETSFWLGLQTFAGETLTLSVEDLTGGTLNVEIGAQSASITAGSGRRKATVTLGGGETGNIAVKLTPASGAVTFKRVKLEFGRQPTAWLALPFEQLIGLCQRYFRKSYNLETAPGTATSTGAHVSLHITGGTATNLYALNLRFEQPMRTTPTVRWFSSTSGTADRVRFASGASLGDHVVNATTASGTKSLGRPIMDGSYGATGDILTCHFTADAEL